ncbi:MAG TPA: metallophosphoesterase [Roseiarcus sp.]|nr:metallophosphoesterase [Roseiarcus sp.]
MEKSLPDTVRAPGVSPSSAKSELERREPDRQRLILDPRDGDAEDDASSPKQKSLLAIAGSLLAEISLTKLLLAWIASIVLPAAILGLAPLIVTAWVGGVFSRVLELYGFSAALLLLAVVAAGWFGWRPLFRVAEANFWALNALGVQPGYALCREAIRHLAEQVFRPGSGAELARMRAMSCAGAGVLLAAVAAMVAAFVWPATRWIGSAADLAVPHQLIWPTLANAVAIMSAYLAAASLVWGFADASMDQPLDLEAFDAAPTGGRAWRVAHLSDIHIVGERYGFRIESGRGGARGNERVRRVMARLEAEHAARPLELILITGDMTDAGRSAEWAEFFDILAGHRDLIGRMLILPGNHDVNVVDRANPARLDLPFSPAKTLRKMRALSAMAAFGADRLRVMSVGASERGPTLAATLAPQRQAIEAFADQGGLRLSNRLTRLWDELFPLILPPGEDEGLGVAILNSNADTNFSFTNALGLIPAGQARKLTAAFDHYPKARWIVALHHHLIEYPMPVAAFSERIGTALVNGSWFQRILKPYAARVIVMHGHRHVDWMGACGELKIVSAPSPVMAPDSEPTHFYVHALGLGPDGRLALMAPTRIDVAAAEEGDAD